MRVRQGHTYVGGASVPFFVTADMIRAGGRDAGFDQVRVFDRKEYPPSLLPKIPPGTDDDWDTVVSGRRVFPDGDVEPPIGSKIRWVVDVTSAPMPLPSPGPAPVPYSPPRPSSWVDAPRGQASAASRPPSSLVMPLAVAAGVVGGVTLGWQAYKHLLVDGLEPQERSGMLAYAASALALWGVSNLLGLEDAWWLSPQGVIERFGSG